MLLRKLLGGKIMNLEEFKKHVVEQREASKKEALEILSATIKKESE
jgi:hypothetical protein